MQRSSASLALISVVLSAIFIAPASAARFSDVQTDHKYYASIEAAAAFGIVKGNPDGTYLPGKNVNRAELLVMLYRARTKNPSAPGTKCKNDVPQGAWFEAVVCDAIKQGYVKGYDDGSFKPEQQVTRAEALKMVRAVLGLTVVSSAHASVQIIPYTDVPKTSWFAVYVASTLNDGDLPFPGETTKLFYPEWPLHRDEAAYLIAKGENLSDVTEGAASSAVSSVASSQVSSRKQWDTSALDEPTVNNVTYPFTGEGFANGAPQLYRFTLTSPVMLQAETSVSEGNVGCRLYKLGFDGLSEEYYLGWQLGTKCVIKASLKPGDYQLDLTPSKEGASFRVALGGAAGDGNDGYKEARMLTLKQQLNSTLAEGDIADWFTFTVKKKTTMTVAVSPTEHLKCFIYPLADVDLEGFDSPDCNAAFLYTTGTYIVGVQRDDSKMQHEFSIELK